MPGRCGAAEQGISALYTVAVVGNAIRPLLKCIFCVSIALPAIVSLEVVLYVVKAKGPK